MPLNGGYDDAPGLNGGLAVGLVDGGGGAAGISSKALGLAAETD